MPTPTMQVPAMQVPTKQAPPSSFPSSLASLKLPLSNAYFSYMLDAI
jgi:hypothetical protein